MAGFNSKRAMAQDKTKEYGMKKVVVRTLLTQELEAEVNERKQMENM